MKCPRCHVVHGIQADGGDRICGNCGYRGARSSFEDHRPLIVQKADAATEALKGQRPLNPAEAIALSHELSKPPHRIHDFRIDSIALIPSPKCGQCDHRMEPHNATHWHCVNPACIHAGKPVHTGGYPFMPIRLEVDPDLPADVVELRQGAKVQARLFNVGEVDEKRFTCPKCGRVSCNPKDIENGYCGACHDFTGDPR